jgi:hypothetical protein
VRYSGFSIGYNVAAAVVSLATAFALRETAGQPLRALAVPR